MKGTKRMRRALAVAVALAATVLPTMVNAGSLDPTAAPAPTMRTMEEMRPAWDQIIPGAQRFVDALDGSAVLDKETGLVWPKIPADAGEISSKTPSFAMEKCIEISLAGRLGWRLPTAEELSTLVDLTQSNPALPAGNPFTIKYNAPYWTSTIDAFNNNAVFFVDMATGKFVTSKGGYYWCVRSGQ